MRQAYRAFIFALIGTVFAANGSNAQAAPKQAMPSAQSLVTAARAKAEAEKKLVMIEFTASWCGWCHAYERFLADTVAGVGRIMRDNFVIVPVVVQESEEALNNPGSTAMLDSYTGGRSSGIPFYAIIDASGKLLGTSNAMPDGSNIGHPANEVEYEAYDRLLAKVAPRITAAERMKIREFLRAMQK